MNTVESKKWTSEAGPRQTKEVQTALYALKNAGQGTRVLSTHEDGTESDHVEQTCFGPKSEAEQAHEAKRQEASANLFNEFGGLITRENFRDIIAKAKAATGPLLACQPVRDERRSVYQIQQDRANRQEAARVQREKQAAEEAEREQAAETVAKDYPYLLRGDRHAGGVAVAKNIRIILKREFPCVKFSVKADYSSVNIRWTDGPTVEAVEEKTGMFKGGSFNGMGDIYEHESSAFTDAFGDVKYIFTSRDYREGLKDAVRASFEPCSNLEGWEQEQHFDRELNKALSATDLTGKGDFTGSTFDFEKQVYVLSFETVPTAQAPTTGGGARVEEHAHTKKGFQMWIVILADRVERGEFNALRDAAKDSGGWYSRAWGSTPAGFAFKDKEAAYAFATSVGGGPSKPTTPTPTKPPTGKADKLREMGERLTKQIEDKQRPLTQNPTPKRTREYRSRLIDGDHMERVQSALFAIADALDAGTWSGRVPTKADLLRYLRTRLDTSRGMYDISDTGEFSDESGEARTVQCLIEGAQDTDRERARLVESKILDLAGVKIPGFFVTHKEVAERVIQEANIQEGDTVLEPSAGTGNLADLARDAGGVVSCLEIRPALAEILDLKGFPTGCDDFLTFNPGKLFDKIVMNPPFENGQDGEHVRKAFDCLKEGGRLVAIMGEGTFFRTDSKATAFRGWLEDHGGYSEKLPEGSFNGGGEVNRTGTNTRLVIIDK